MNRYKLAGWGENVSDIQNAGGNPLYKTVELKWSSPTIWRKQDRCPSFDTSEPFLYTLIRNHGSSMTKDHIVYVGLTTSPNTRFGNHKKARAIVKMRGEVKFSFAPIDFIRGRNRIDRIGLKKLSIY
jgi:hypothetical protein